MRTFTAGLLAALGTGSHLVTVTRTDGTVTRYTDAGDTVVVGAQTYLGRPGCTVNSIAWESGSAAATLDIELPMGGASPITKADLVAGYYDNAEITVDVFSWASPAEGSERLATGMIGNVDYTDAGNVRFDVVGLWGLAVMLRMRTYGPMCGTQLGHPLWCQIPVRPADVLRSTAYALGATVRYSTGGTLAGYGNRYFEATTGGTTAGTAPAFNYTINATTADGSVVWTARDSWTRYGVVDSIESARAVTATIDEARAVDGWFSRGAGMFGPAPGGGANFNRAFDVRRWTRITGSTGRISLWVPLPGTIQVGDQFEIHVGDPLTMEICHSRFNNLRHFQGFPHLSDVPFGSLPVDDEAI